MRERPILFNGEMVRAILAGKKTQTRRAVNWDTAHRDGCSVNVSGPDGYDVLDRANMKTVRLPWVPEKLAMLVCPLGVPGDRFWVREAWYSEAWGDGLLGWKADGDFPHGQGYRVRPSIHMPRWASRITLEITGVRVERLQDITDADAKAEGCEPHPGIENKDGSPCYTSSFQEMWVRQYGVDNPKAWESNPWVWVIEFKVVEAQEARDAA